MNQYAMATGNKFDEYAAEKVMLFSDGHPWSVNRILNECVKSSDHKIITENDIYQVFTLLCRRFMV